MLIPFDYKLRYVGNGSYYSCVAMCIAKIHSFMRQLTSAVTHIVQVNYWLYPSSYKLVILRVRI